MPNLHPYSCACNWSGTLDDTAAIKAIESRVSPGEFMPAGQCPRCGDLIEVRDQDIPVNTLENAAEILRQRGWIVAKPECLAAPVIALEPLETLRPYDHQDYTANPDKYGRFKTARITAKNLKPFTHGQTVRIEFFALRINQGRGNAVMPVFKVWPSCDPDRQDDFSILYASALGNFCL